MTVVLRPLRAEDLAELDIWFADPDTQLWLGGPGWAAQALRLADPANGRRAIVALLDGARIGLVDLECYPDGRASFALVIAPERRRLGLAAGVMQAVFASPALAGIHEVFGGIEQGNLASAALARRLGMMPVAPPDAEGFTCFAMRLDGAGIVPGNRTP